MAKTRRQFAGGAVASTLTGSVAASGVTTFGVAASTNWSTSTTIPFYVVVSPQTSSEEKMLVTLSSNTLTIVSRAVDGTSAASHASGAAIYPVFTAKDADEANELTAKYANRGSIVYQGASTFEELVKGTQGHALVIGSNDPAWGQVDTVGIKDDAVTTAKIALGAVGSDEIATDAVTATEIAADAVTTAKILDLNVTTAKIADDAVTLDKLATAVLNALVPVGTIAMFGNAVPPTGWLLCNGDAIDAGYTILKGLVGNNTPDLKGRFALGDNATLNLLATGGSFTIGTTNLPAHSHANTASASTTVGILDPTHSHTGTVDAGGTHNHAQEVESTSSTGESHSHGTSGTAGNPDGSNTTGNDDTATSGNHSHTFTSAAAATGISATAATTVTMTNAETGGAQDYFQPYLVVNYIIKHD